jgi:hypothetical protein
MAIVDPFQCCSASEFVPLEIWSAAFVSNACGYCCHCCLKTLINCSIFICAIDENGMGQLQMFSGVLC